MEEIDKLIDLLSKLKDKKESPVEIEKKILELSILIKEKINKSQIDEEFLKNKMSDLKNSISKISNQNRKNANTIIEFKNFLEKKK
tara:strand:- start:761 stop:1018 length:258 start_codon:yes stop_codon:yes gene_type:complete